MTDSMIEKLRPLVRRIRARVRELKFRVPFSPYRRMSSRDRRHFADVLAVWRPPHEMPVVLLRWLMTEWCNYSCAYCPQTHDRYATKGDHTAHAFDNRPVEAWIESFHRHFESRRLSLVVTGGEPMLDRKSMPRLLEALTAMPTLDCVRIDTNASWEPGFYEKVDRSKVVLMCTFHPSQITEERFVARIQQFQAAGFTVAMVNYVMNRENFARYSEVKEVIHGLGVPLHPNPLWNSEGSYSEDDLALLRRELPAADFRYRTGLESPFGKECLFPALSYEMDESGKIWVGCHPETARDFFTARAFPEFAGPVPCPAKWCICLDKYSFLEEVNRNTSTNPFDVYSQVLKKRGNQPHEPIA